MGSDFSPFAVGKTVCSAGVPPVGAAAEEAAALDALVVVRMVVAAAEEAPPPEQGKHWLYHSLLNVQQDPETQVVAPVHPVLWSLLVVMVETEIRRVIPSTLAVDGRLSGDSSNESCYKSNGLHSDKFAVE